MTINESELYDYDELQTVVCGYWANVGARYLKNPLLKNLVVFKNLVEFNNIYIFKNGSKAYKKTVHYDPYYVQFFLGEHLLIEYLWDMFDWHEGAKGFRQM